MKTNIITYLLVPTLILSPPIASASSSHIEGDSEGNTIVIGRGETTTNPGGFSSVAEPAGPLAYSRAIPVAPSQRNSHHHRNLVTVQPLLRRLLRHHFKLDESTQINHEETQ